MTENADQRPDVFVSYCRDDRASVATIVSSLEAGGRTVWWDARLEAGDAFDAEIAAALRAAKCVLVCWSARSIESDWVRAEALDGRKRGVLISCLLEPCDRSRHSTSFTTKTSQAGAVIAVTLAGSGLPTPLLIAASTAGRRPCAR